MGAAHPLLLSYTPEVLKNQRLQFYVLWLPPPPVIKNCSKISGLQVYPVNKSTHDPEPRKSTHPCSDIILVKFLYLSVIEIIFHACSSFLCPVSSPPRCGPNGFHHPINAPLCSSNFLSVPWYQYSPASAHAGCPLLPSDTFTGNCTLYTWPTQ